MDRIGIGTDLLLLPPVEGMLLGVEQLSPALLPARPVHTVQAGVRAVQKPRSNDTFYSRYEMGNFLHPLMKDKNPIPSPTISLHR